VDFLHPTIQRILGDTIYQFVGLGILITVSIALTLRIRQRFHGNDDPAEVDHQMLLQIKELRREGDLTDEEFRSIKGRLVERIDDSFTQADR
jgi:hypothetical protein